MGISLLDSLGNITQCSTLSDLPKSRGRGGAGPGTGCISCCCACKQTMQVPSVGICKPAVVSHSNQKTRSGHQTVLHHVYLAVLLGAAP